MVALQSCLLASLLVAVHVAGNTISDRQIITDKQCGGLMCVSATVNGSNVDYVLTSLGKRELGWMAMGFGRTMANTPMVIMWANDGKVILSQRRAPAEVMPTVDPNPPQVAKVADSLTSIAGDSSTFGFTVPTSGDSRQFIIFAYGTSPPGSSEVDAPLEQHYEARSALLNLSGQSSTPASSGSSPTPTKRPTAEHKPNPYDDIPLLSYQRSIVAHAIFCVAGFLLFLPSGTLLARYLRTFTSKWFTGHWFIQLVIAGPTIVVGIALGIRSVSKAGAMHLNDTHKKLGVTIFALYAFQLIMGAVIHWVKPRNKTRRPFQNYFHAILGLLIIALAMYQTYSGFTAEWSKTTGREPFPKGVNILFYIWVPVLTIAYFGGLIFLPKQLKQENKLNLFTVPDEHAMHDQYVDRD